MNTNSVLSSTKLLRASELSTGMEAIDSELTTLNARVAELTAARAPLSQEYDTLMGVEVKKSTSLPKRVFSQEHKDKIAAGVRAAAVRRNAAATPAAPATDASVVATA